jgi:hypothetical protein
MSNILKKSIHADDLTKINREKNQSENVRIIAKRIVISISNSCDPSAKATPILYEHVSNVLIQSKILNLESLIPIPILSASIDSIDDVKLKNVLIDFVGTESKFRIVCGIGLVEYGNFGNSSIMAFGSFGDVTLNVIEGIFLLPNTNSWIDENVANLLKIPLIEGHKIFKSTFYKYS